MPKKPKKSNHIGPQSILSRIALWLHRLKLPGLEGLSVYDLLKLYFVGIIKGTFSTRASSIAFSFFMAIFPFLLFILNLIPFVWFIADFQTELLSFIESIIPPQTTGFFEDIFFDIANNPRGGLLSFVFILSIFLMANGVNAIFTSFEFSYHTVVNRTIIRQYVVAVGVAIIIAILVLITVIATIYLTYLIEEFRNLRMLDDNLIYAQIGRYLIFVFMLTVIISVLYYFGTREGRRSRFFSVGAIFTTILIIVTTYLFTIYVENFNSYNKLYGSIGTLLILMLYIWLNANVLLLGFELNGALYRLRNRN